MGIQKKRPSSRSLPAGRAGFAVNACSLGMPHARACGKARRHRRLATRRVFLSDKNHLRYSAFVCAGSGSRNVSNKRWLAPQCGLPPPRNFPDNSEFTGNFQKLWLSATSETQIPAKARSARPNFPNQQNTGLFRSSREICSNNQGTERCPL